MNLFMILIDAVSPVILAGGLIGLLAIIAALAFSLFWLIRYIRNKN